MRKLFCYVMIITFCIINLVQADKNNVDYSKINFISWEKLNKNNLNPQFINNIDLFKIENSEFSIPDIEEIYPSDESWVIKKYDQNKLYEAVSEDNDVYINAKWIFSFAWCFRLNNQKKVALVLNDNKNNFIAPILNNIEVSTNNSQTTRKIVELENAHDIVFGSFRLIDNKSEFLFSLGWINESSFGVADYAYIKLYKYNLLKEQVEIFDSYTFGIITNGIDEIEGFFPLYDMSLDRRFIYIPARNDIEYTKTDTFKREKIKLNGGLYVYDWWENKLFKLAKGNVVDVTNNTEDGYVYYKVMKREDRKRVYEYYRFKNPEEMLRKH